MNVRNLYWEISRGFKRSYALGFAGLLFVDLLSLLPPLALSLLIDSVVKGSPGVAPLTIAAGYIGIIVIQNLFRYPLRMGSMGVAIRIAGRLRERYADHLLFVDRASFACRTSGDLLSRATNDVEIVERGLSLGVLFLVDAVIYLLAIPVVLMLMNPTLTLYALAPLPFVAVGVRIMIGAIGKATAVLLDSAGRMNARALENASAAQTIRAYGLEGREIDRFEGLAAEHMAKNLALARLEAIFSVGLQVLTSLGVFAVLTLGGLQVVRRELTTGQLVAFLQYMGMTAWPLSGLSWGLVLLRKGGESLQRIDEILRLPGVHGEIEPLQVPLTPPLIEVRHLTYRHPGSTEPALRDVTLRIRPGERIGLIGAIASGKSTLIDLLCRIVEPPAGTVFVDGQDVTGLPKGEVRRWFAVVPQESFLFSETLRENIRLGVEGRVVGPAEVEEAARAAQVTRDCYPQGLETPVNDRGTTLSGGQRQRVALARALLRKAPILLLDDATSALDRVTEERVFRELDSLARGSTLVFTTHRISSVRTADRILLLDDGRLVEEGTHEELLARNGAYAGLVRDETVEEVLDRP